MFQRQIILEIKLIDLYFSHLQGTVGQGGSLCIWCKNQPPRDCWPGVQPVYTVSESPPGLSLRYSLFIWSPNQPSGDCQPEVQPFHTELEPTSRGLLVGKQSVYTLSEPTFRRGCSLLIRCQKTRRGLLAQGTA